MALKPSCISSATFRPRSLKRSLLRSLFAERLEDRRLLALDAFAGSGITSQYFADTSLQQIVETRLESSVNQDWGASAPVAGLNVDAFSARFIGQVEAAFTEPHTFSLSADGGARLWINGVKVVDQWDANSVTANASVDLISGRRYDIQLEYRETGGDADVSLAWSSPSQSTQLIPSSKLFASERGSIQSRVWNAVSGSNLSDLTTLGTYPNQPELIQNLSSFEVPTSGTLAKSGTVSGLLHPPTTGDYQFFVTGDGVAELWLGNTSDSGAMQRIAVNNAPSSPGSWTQTPAQQSEAITLVAGQSYAIELIYRNGSTNDRVAVGWTTPQSSSIEVVSGENLSAPLATVSVFSKQVQAAEGSSTPIEFVVQRDGQPTTNPLVVSYSLRGGATPGVDYAGSTIGTVTIPANESSASVTIAPLVDASNEGVESLIFEVIDGPGYDVGLISQRRGQASIGDVVDPPAGALVVSPAIPLSGYGKFGGAFSSITPTAPYSRIFQAVISTKPANSYNAQLKIDSLSGFGAGDVLLADFYVRSIGGVGQITAVAETNGASYDKSLDRTFEVPTQWTRIQLPFVTVKAYPTGVTPPMSFGFFLGAKVQTIQFADIRLYAYGQPRDITPASLQLNGRDSFGTTTTIAVANQPFDTAARIETVTTPTGGTPAVIQPWRFQYGGRNSAIVQNGNTLVLEFYARSVAGAVPRIQVVIQTTDTYATLKSQTIQPSSAWQKYTVSVNANADYGIQGLQAMMNLGFEPQTVEIADIRWTNDSALVDIGDLPSLATSSSYVGRNGDDAWRATADADIAADRKAELNVHVIDAAGNPVTGAVVSIRQTSHDFRFGSAIDGSARLDPNTTDPAYQKYQSEIKRLFNTVVIENSMKWPQLIADRSRAIAVANWAVDNDLYLRGHNVIWPSEDNLPASVWGQYQTILATGGSLNAKNYLSQAIATHIQDVATIFAGITGEWDIVNEPFTNHDVMDALGSDSVVVDWFNLFRQFDPTGDRVLNDYDIFANNGGNTAHRTNFGYWLTMLNNADAIERIGEQSHYTEGNLTDIAVLGSLIDTYHNQFNLPIAITEFDVTSKDRQLQADYLRDYLTMTFSKSAIDEFLNWGFWSEAHWRPDAAMYNADFAVRPHGQVYEDLVFGSWWTDTRGTTRNDGDVTVDVFKGDYEITVTRDGQSVTRSLSNFADDGTMVFALPGIVWSETSLTSSEGVTTQVSASLSEAPASDVSITIGSNSQVSVSPSQLTFTPLNWNISQTIDVTPIEDYTVEGPQSAILNVTLSSTDAKFDAAPVISPSIDFADGQAPLRVNSVTIGDNDVSRSVIRKVVVEFDGLATIQTGAFQIEKLVGGQAASNLDLSFIPEDVDSGGGIYRTRVAITFTGTLTGPASVNAFGGLMDGDYRLTIDPNLVTKQNTTAVLDGNSDGVPGGSYSIGDNPLDRFFALYGDASGDGVVAFADYLRFRASYGSRAGNSRFESDLDYNGDGLIGFAEYIQFRANYTKHR